MKACLHSKVEDAQFNGTQLNVHDIFQACSGYSAAPSGGGNSPASGPSSAPPFVPPVPPHFIPGSCPVGLSWCGARQACLPSGVPCGSIIPPVMPPHYIPGLCPAGLSWCSAQQACIPSGTLCGAVAPPIFPPHIPGSCPPTLRWCHAQQACIPAGLPCGGNRQCYGSETWCPSTQSCVDPRWGESCPQPHPPCLATAGYSWCESSGKCVRPWEEPCPSSSHTGGGYGLPYAQAFPNALGQELSSPFMPVDANVHGEFDTHISTSDFNMSNPLSGGFTTPTNVYSNAVGGQFAGFRSLF